MSRTGSTQTRSDSRGSKDPSVTSNTTTFYATYVTMQILHNTFSTVYYRVRY